jgi:hypothetical protein
MAARIIHLRVADSTRLTIAQETQTDLMLESVPFMSACPKCKDLRHQQGYGERTLLRLLNRNHPIEAYCGVCGAFWPISANERSELARRLTD